MKYLKIFEEFSQFIMENQETDRDLELLRLGLADPRDVFNLPIGEDSDDYDDDLDDDYDEHIEGDIEALKWLDFPKRIVLFGPNSHSFRVDLRNMDYMKDEIRVSINRLGQIAKSLIVDDVDNPIDEFFDMDHVRLENAINLYSYSDLGDWGTYWGTSVNGKRVVVLDAPDGPYFLFAQSDFSELDLTDYEHSTLKNDN